MTSSGPVPTDALFQPADIVWTPVSPRLAGARLTVAAIVLVPLLLAGVVWAVLSGAAAVWIAPAAVLAVGVWIGWLVPRQVHAVGYAERADDLLIRRGIMFKTLVVVPYGRMQYVDVNAGPVDRAFGIAAVQLHTAAPNTDASIHGLPPEEAARLRDRLASRGEARLAGL
ncbi:PH domain-containing protein [Cellulomonas sp. SG140]|uniref:PH domain-containing protein n=1 Tax=Cellulomonas sp. SG140 TaxID=2976536 RepID=UPI0021E73301|nr:PH domain-containing protein [Cellulomonas sp. SG140]